MTTLYENQDTCAICGEISQHQAVGSTNKFGAPDLDLRPPEMVRSAVQYAIRRCPSCGYCANRLSEELANAQDVVRRSEYREQLVDSDFPELANNFLCWSLILEAGRRHADAGWAVVNAAWVCDDAALNGGDSGAYERATRCRLRAVELLKRAQASGELFFVHVPGGQEALLADLLRRSGQFDAATAACDRGLHAQATKTEAEHPDDAMTVRVLRFQRTLAARGDAACHRLSEMPVDTRA